MHFTGSSFQVQQSSNRISCSPRPRRAIPSIIAIAIAQALSSAHAQSILKDDANEPAPKGQRVAQAAVTASDSDRKSGAEIEKSEADKAQRVAPIIVTGTRPREYSDSPINGYKADGTSALGFELELQQAPASVNVLSADFAKDAGVRRLNEALNFLPGVTIGDNGGSNVGGVLIRGFEAKPTVNGIPQRITSRPAYSFINIERVEVLKGVSGVEGNIDDFGGTIDLVTKKPQRTAAHRIELGAGDYRQWRAVVDSTGPLTRDGNLQYRLIGGASQEAVWRPSRPRGNPRSELLPSLSWDYASGSNVLVEAQWIRVNNPTDRGGLYIEGAGFPGNFTPREWSIHQQSDREASKFQQYDLTWNHRFNRAWNFKFNAQQSRNRQESTGFRNGNTEGDFLFAADGVTWNGTGVEIPIFADDDRNSYDSRGWAAELRWSPTFGTTQHTAKLVASSSRGASVYSAGGIRGPRGFFLNTANTVNLFAPDNTQTLRLADPPFDGPYYPLFRDIEERKGIALQWLAQWSPRWRTVMGARRETTDRLFGDFGATAEEVGFEPFSENANDLRSRAFRLGTSYDITDDVSVFATVADGSFAQAAIARGGAKIDTPKLVRNAEVGLKWSVAGGKALATVAAYQLNERNLLAGDCLPEEADCVFQKLVGGRRIRGVELDLRGEVVRGVQLGASVALQDAKILESPAGFTGNRFSNTPRMQGSAFVNVGWARFGLPSVKTSLGVVHVAERFGNSGNTIRIPAYTLVNIGANWEARHDLTLSFNVSNLLDKTYYTAMQDNDSAASDQVGVGDRRLINFNLEWRF
jgi:iron complex outermembrane recepter protein